jgi:hypothetical protein
LKFYRSHPCSHDSFNLSSLETAAHAPQPQLPRDLISLHVCKPLLDLLLRPQLVGVATLLLAAVGCTWWETSLGKSLRVSTPASTASLSLKCTYVALSADHLVAVVLARQRLERWLDDTTPQSQHQVKRALLLNVVV